MRTVRIVVVVVIVVAGGLAAWLLHRRGGSDTPATATLTQPNGSSVVPGSTSAPVEPAQLAITVTDAKGPLAAAIRLDGGEVTTARTGRDGIARVELAPGDYAISASADGHVPRAIIRKLAAGEHAAIELVLAEGGHALTGVVTDSYGGPIASARVDAAALGGMLKPGQAIAMATTGADGRYTLTVAAGQLLVGVSHPEYAPQARFVELGDAGATADFALVPGGVIEGVVRDERTKEPVAGARIVAERDQPAMQLSESGSHTLVAGADGKFRITGLRPGAYELVASAAGRRSRTPTRVGLGVAEQLTDVEILVGLGAVVRGKVVDDKGAPAGGVTVVAMGMGGRDAEATARPDGAFELSGLAPGKHFLRGQGNAYVPDHMVPVEVAQRDVDGVVVRVKKGEKVTGHVEPRQPCEVRMDLDDDSLASGQMPMLLAPITTDADGNFELAPLSPGKATFAARCPSGDQGALAVDVEPGLAPQVIAVVPGASIAGHVLDGDGKPVANATVIASARGTSEHVQLVDGVVTSGVQALTTSTGAFELRGLAAATYALAVQDRGRPLRPRRAPPVIALGPTDHKTGVDLAVDRPTGKISGTVTGPDGKPLADAWVSARQSMQDLIAGMVDRGGEPEAGRTIMVNASSAGGGSSTELPPALTDAAGHFELTGLPHVKYQVVAEAQAGKLRGRAADVMPDATIALQALALTSLSGTVRSASGPAGLFTVELIGPTRLTRSFTQGAFEIGRVDPGSYVVHVTSADGNGEAAVTVVAGQAATVDIALAANAVVIGKLVDATGKPGAHLAYAIVEDKGDGHMAISLEGPPPTTGEDGAFRIEAKPGKKIFVVMTQPRPFAKRGLVLEAGKTLDLGAVDYTAVSIPTPPPP